jgi:RimJ/RimL family protein N-acetyltransferase
MSQISFRPTARHLAYGPADVGWHPFRLDRIASTVLTALRATLQFGWHRLRQAWRYSAALRELHALDARTLKDLGLHRGDLRAIADAYAHRGIVGRFGAVRLGRVEIADVARCVEFAGLLHPNDIRLRFGRPAALSDAGTFRRLFGLDDRKIETIGLFDLSGQILGLATVAWVRPGTAEIALIIRSDLQRRGLGAALLANVIRDARDAGFRLLLAHIGYGNVPMRRLAHRFGFEFAGTAPSAEAQLVIRR